MASKLRRKVRRVRQTLKGSLKPWLRVWRRRSRRQLIRTGVLAACLVLLVAVVVYRYSMPTTINPAAYTPLLNTIAKGESNGNYNAYFGNAANTDIIFTEMPVGEVLQWQEAYVRGGSPSSAVGKYQIIRTTLNGLVHQLAIDLSMRFDEALQDRLAIALLERRGAVAYVEKELTREQFAANLAQEWAALPRVTGGNPAESYYAHDGLNKSGITVDELYAALTALENKASAL